MRSLLASLFLFGSLLRAVTQCTVPDSEFYLPGDYLVGALFEIHDAAEVAKNKTPKAVDCSRWVLTLLGYLWLFKYWYEYSALYWEYLLTFDLDLSFCSPLFLFSTLGPYFTLNENDNQVQQTVHDALTLTLLCLNVKRHNSLFHNNSLIKHLKKPNIQVLSRQLYIICTS